MGVPRFDVIFGPTNQIQFKLYDGPELVITSHGFPNKAACFKAIQLVKENARVDQRYEKKNIDGKFSFTLKAATHEVLANGGPYESADAREKVITLLRKSVEAAVTDKA